MLYPQVLTVQGYICSNSITQRKVTWYCAWGTHSVQPEWNQLPRPSLQLGQSLHLATLVLLLILVLNVHVSSFVKRSTSQSSEDGSSPVKTAAVQQTSEWVRVLVPRSFFTSRHTAAPLQWDVSSGSFGLEGGQCVQTGPAMSTGPTVSGFLENQIASAIRLQTLHMFCSHWVNSAAAWCYLIRCTVVTSNDLSTEED